MYFYKIRVVGRQPLLMNHAELPFQLRRRNFRVKRALLAPAEPPAGGPLFLTSAEAACSASAELSLRTGDVYWSEHCSEGLCRVLTQALRRLGIREAHHSEIILRVFAALKASRRSVPSRLEICVLASDLPRLPEMVGNDLREWAKQARRLGLDEAGEGLRGSGERLRYGEESGKVEGDGVCAVCMRELGGPRKMARMPCEHVFHRACVEEWVAESSSCPVCRFQLPWD